jgi:hypothetical protein
VRWDGDVGKSGGEWVPSIAEITKGTWASGVIIFKLRVLSSGIHHAAC